MRREKEEMKNFSPVETHGSRCVAVAMRSRSCNMKTERKGNDIALEPYPAGLSFLNHNVEKDGWFPSHLLFFPFYKPILIGLYFS